MSRFAAKTIVLALSCLSVVTVAIGKDQPVANKAAVAVNNTAFNSGIALYGQKNYRAAAQQFEQAIKTSPNNADAYYYCALCHQQSNNLPRAKQLFEYIGQRFPQSRVAPMAATALNQLSSYSSSSSSAKQSADDERAFSPFKRRAAISMSNVGGAQDDLAGVPDLVRIPFEKHGNDVIVQVQVNGRSVPFVLDTGAASIALGQNHLRDWGISTAQAKKTFDVGGIGDGKAKGWIQKLDIKLGPIYRREFPCQVQDNMPTEPLLGQTFLRSFNVNIDDNARIVVLAKKSGKAAKDVAHRSYYAKEIPFTRSGGGHMWVDVKVNGKPIKMIFDTGAEQTAFSASDWQKMGFTVPDNAQQGISRGVLGESTAYFFTTESIQLGPLEQNNTPVHVIENSKAPPLLGMSFYGKYRVIVDVNRNVLIFNEP